MIGTIKTYQRPKALTARSGPATSGAGVNLKGGRGSVPAALPAGRCACPGSPLPPELRGVTGVLLLHGRRSQPGMQGSAAGPGLCWVDSAPLTGNGGCFGIADIGFQICYVFPGAGPGKPCVCAEICSFNNCIE